MSACPPSTRPLTREPLLTCSISLRGVSPLQMRTPNEEHCLLHQSASASALLLRRFLNKNKVYPDDVIVIESGINDILVRPTVVDSLKRHVILVEHSSLGARHVSQGSTKLQPHTLTSQHLGRP